jgi:hypothetical protein
VARNRACVSAPRGTRRNPQRPVRDGDVGRAVRRHQAARIRAARRHRIVYRDGVPLAVREGDGVRELAPIDSRIAADVSRALKTRFKAAAV